MTTIYSILLSIVGTPTNDTQITILYLGATAISVLLFFSVVYVFKVISNTFR